MPGSTSGELRLFGIKPKLRDGRRASHMRCDCLTRANLVAIVKNGEITFAGCPVCGKNALVEVLPDGEIGFFPMGTVVI